MKSKWFYRTLHAIAPRAGRLLARLLFSTCRISWQHDAAFKRLLAEGKPCIIVFWHYGVLYAMMGLEPQSPTVCMVSASKDGEYISRLLRLRGYETVRGSSNAGGLSATRAILRKIRAGYSAALVADGSRGPARKAQAGAIVLASRAGAHIVPVNSAASRYFEFRSWDRAILPKPFSAIRVEWGEPFVVPKGIAAREIEQWRQILEARLDEVYHEAWRAFGKEQH